VDSNVLMMNQILVKMLYVLLSLEYVQTDQLQHLIKLKSQMETVAQQHVDVRMWLAQRF
jgi:hypothetical protein